MGYTTDFSAPIPEGWNFATRCGECLQPNNCYCQCPDCPQPVLYCSCCYEAGCDCKGLDVAVFDNTKGTITNAPRS